MKSVGVKILKARLSEYLRLVKAGETVLVTERDEVVAELRPTHRAALNPRDWAHILDQLSEEGRAVLRAEEPSAWEGPSTKLHVPTGTIAEILDDLRKDRDE